MRYKPEHKKETHQRIVESASKEFRTHGLEGYGIAKLMGSLNLTHGGFYAHFADKEDLVSESLALALSQSLDTLLDYLNRGGLTAMIDYYLSEEHRDHPELGCPLPTLAAEVARRSSSSRNDFTENLSKTFNAIAEHMPGQTDDQKRSHVYVLFAAMVGAVSLARSVTNPELSKALLRSNRDALLKFIEEIRD